MSFSIDKGQQEILEQHRQYRVILNRQQTQEKLNSPLRKKKIQTLMSRQNSISKRQITPPSGSTLRIQNLLRRTNTNYDYEQIQGYSNQLESHGSQKQVGKIHNSTRKHRAISEFNVASAAKSFYN